MQERFYFGDAVLPLFESGVPLLLERLAQLPDRNNVSSRPTDAVSTAQQGSCTARVVVRGQG